MLYKKTIDLFLLILYLAIFLDSHVSPNISNIIDYLIF